MENVEWRMENVTGAFVYQSGTLGFCRGAFVTNPFSRSYLQLILSLPRDLADK
jgi:hypothetical protein